MQVIVWGAGKEVKRLANRCFDICRVERYSRNN